MFDRIINAVLRRLPAPVRNELLFRKDQLFKESVAKKWEQQGKPVPPPHIIKQRVIDYYRQRHGYDTLIETGTYLGHMLVAQRQQFSKLYSIELSPDFWKYNVKKFRKYPHVQILQGDSGSVLPTLTKQLTKPAIFWLDGHYSMGTAKGELDCPVREELRAIFNSPIKQHVVLIDDARDFTGSNDYPTIAEIQSFVVDQRVKHTFEVKDDVIRIVLL